MNEFTLAGTHVRLEPLQPGHAEGLLRAASGDPELYRWSPVPQSTDDVVRYIETAIAGRNAGTAVPFAILDARIDRVIGSTRFFDLERWEWPPQHPRLESSNYDVGEIGYTWLTSSAIRTAANTEAKLLMLSHAFEHWNLLRVCLHTDARNTRSRAAIERIGAKFEGILRAHRIASDATPRDSARYSIIASEWAAVKANLCSGDRKNR